MLSPLYALAQLLWLASQATSRTPDGHPADPAARLEDNLTTAFATAYLFDQLIDHNNPSLGIFKQRYFFSDEFHAGPASPIILVPGYEPSAMASFDLWLRGLMELHGAAGVVIEHRYFGQSIPFDPLTTENVQFLTSEQATEDYAYFIEGVQLPFSKEKTPDSTIPDQLLRADTEVVSLAFPPSSLADSGATDVRENRVNNWVLCPQLGFPTGAEKPNCPGRNAITDVCYGISAQLCDHMSLNISDGPPGSITVQHVAAALGLFY